jgi:DNA-binding NarL/FixJ family response regulator
VVQILARVAAGRHVHRLVPLRAEGAEPVAPYLTAREREVLALLATGASTTEMRERLDVSEHTVRTHVRSVLSKLGAHSRVEALRVAHDRGLVQTRAAGR